MPKFLCTFDIGSHFPLFSTQDILKTFPAAVPALRDVITLLFFVFFVYAIRESPFLHPPCTIIVAHARIHKITCALLCAHALARARAHALSQLPIPHLRAHTHLRMHTNTRAHSQLHLKMILAYLPSGRDMITLMSFVSNVSDLFSFSVQPSCFSALPPSTRPCTPFACQRSKEHILFNFTSPCPCLE